MSPSRLRASCSTIGGVLHEEHQQARPRDRCGRHRAEGSVRIGADDRIRVDVEGDRREADGSWRYSDGTSTVYGTPLCVTGTEEGPGKTVAIGLWFNRSSFPGGSPFAQGKFGVHYIQEKSGPDASAFVAETSAVSCPANGFAFPGGLVEVTSGSYDVKVEG